ncbi:hypothetical protein [Nocardia xishanensis]
MNRTAAVLSEVHNHLRTRLQASAKRPHPVSVRYRRRAVRALVARRAGRGPLDPRVGPTVIRAVSSRRIGPDHRRDAPRRAVPRKDVRRKGARRRIVRSRTAHPAAPRARPSASSAPAGIRRARPGPTR